MTTAVGRGRVSGQPDEAAKEDTNPDQRAERDSVRANHLSNAYAEMAETLRFSHSSRSTSCSKCSLRSPAFVSFHPRAFHFTRCECETKNEIRRQSPSRSGAARPPVSIQRIMAATEKRLWIIHNSAVVSLFGNETICVSRSRETRAGNAR